MRSQSSQSSVSPHVSCSERKSILKNGHDKIFMGGSGDTSSLATSITDCSTFFSDATFGNSASDFGTKHSNSERKEMQENVERVLRFAQRRLKKTGAEPFYGKHRKKYGDSNGGGILHVQHSDVELDSVLGKGSYNVVYSVKSVKGSLLDREEIVVKTLRSKLLSDPPMLAACAADLRKEGLLLASLQLPPSAMNPGSENIVKCLGWTPTGLSAFANGCHDSYFLILEKLDRTLTDTLEEWRILENVVETEKHRESLKSSKPHGKASNRSVLLSNVKNSFFKSEPHQPKLDSSERDQSTASTYSNSTVCEAEQIQFWKLRLGLLMDLCGAIAFLHSRMVIHRDIKPDNVGFDRTGKLKIFDFDVSRVLPCQANYRDERFKMTKKVGSPRYMSPEVARGETYNEKSDVYALGLLAYEILTLKRPFDGLSSNDRGAKGGNVYKDCVKVVIRAEEQSEGRHKPKRRNSFGNSFGNFAFRKSGRGRSAAADKSGSGSKLGEMFRRRRSHSRGSSKKSHRKNAKYANLRPRLPVATPQELEQSRHSGVVIADRTSSQKSSSSIRSHHHSVNDIEVETTSLFWTRSLRTTIDQAWSYDIPTRPIASELQSLLGEELERIELHEGLTRIV